MNLAHPLSITLCQVIIYGNDMNTFPFQRIQICRQCRYQRLTFTGTHLCNTALMQDHTTDQLYTEMAQPDGSLGSLSYNGISLRKNIIQRLALCQSFLELIRFPTEFLI